MTEKKAAGFDFDSTNLVVFLYQWRLPLIIVSLVAAVSAVVFSGTTFIKPKFKSTVIMFPTSTASTRTLIGENNNSKDDLLAFGEEEQAEQLIQILNSDEIRRKIVERYNLMNHYEIDTTDQYKYTKLVREYESNISFKRTEFMSVQIDVLDTDPVKAAAIANDIGALVDTIKNRMVKERAVMAMKIAEDEYLEMKGYVKELEDSLNQLRGMGINDYESQSEVFNDAYAQAISKGNSKAAKELEEKLKVLAQYGGAYVSIRDQLEHEKEQLSHLRAKYQEAKVDAEQTLPYKFIVDNAFPAEKKSYPIRWLIVIVSTIASFLMAVLVIIMVENFKKVKP